MKSWISTLALALASASAASAQVTVYTAAAGQESATSSADSASYTGLPAYDPTTLVAPAAPNPPTTGMAVVLPANPADLFSQGLQLSIPQKGNFLGFSVELSVADTILGKTPGTLKIEFLNYLQNIRNRAGVGPIVRVGGNSQEDSSIWADGLADGLNIDKIRLEGTSVTTTPIINYSADLLHTMANISTLTDTRWYFGLSFNESAVTSPTGNIPVAATLAQQILGDKLLGLGLSNEPDLYVDHNKRPAGWNLQNYVDEFSTIKNEVLNQGTLTNKQFLVGPSVCCNVVGFDTGDIFNAGWVDQNIDNLAALTVQHYPTNNCNVNGKVINAQDIFQEFLNHTSAKSLTAPYLSATEYAQAHGKEMVMLEMNSASCGGFPGLSDNFGVALWMADWALQMAWGNFSAALMHVGGQNVYYNPFTPPPSNRSTIQQWTTGSVYYPTLLIAETLGQSGKARVVDLAADNANIYHPAYAIYEDDVPTRVALFNYVEDSTGGSDIQVTISINNAALSQGSVSVRYFRAPSVSEKYNITWASQTLGTSFTSDGRLSGNVETVTIQCDTTAQTCTIPVYAPSFALVFLNDQALTGSTPPADATATFATTVIGKGSATVNVGALQTGNGQAGSGGGSTSSGSVSAASRSVDPGFTLAVAPLAALAAACILL